VAYWLGLSRSLDIPFKYFTTPVTVTSLPPTLRVGGPVIIAKSTLLFAATTRKMITCCLCFCPALRNPFSYLKKNQIAGFRRQIFQKCFGVATPHLPAAGGATSPRTIPCLSPCFMLSSPNIFDVPRPLTVTSESCWCEGSGAVADAESG